MTFINYNTKEINFKIIYYGPSGSGKTRNLRHIFENTNDSQKGELVTIADGKQHSAYFDFLPVFLGKVRGYNTRLHLYAVPGAQLQDPQRKLLMKGVDGIVFVADSHPARLDENVSTLIQLKAHLADFRYSLDRIPHVLQYNRRDADNAVSLETMSKMLNEFGAEEFETNAKEGDGVLETLKAISKMVLKDVVKAR